MTVEDLELAVSKLSSEELMVFSQWFEEFLADQWDMQIEADILTGRLDTVGKRADDALQAGLVTPL